MNIGIKTIIKSYIRNCLQIFIDEGNLQLLMVKDSHSPFQNQYNIFSIVTELTIDAGYNDL